MKTNQFSPPPQTLSAEQAAALQAVAKGDYLWKYERSEFDRDRWIARRLIKCAGGGAKRILIEGSKDITPQFDRVTGKGAVGYKNYYYRILVATPHEVAEEFARQRAEQMKEEHARLAKEMHENTEAHKLASHVHWCDHETLESLPIEQLRQIAAWIDAAKK